MFHPTHKLDLGQLVSRVANSDDYLTLPEFLLLKGCARVTAYRRQDITSAMVRDGGRVFVHRSALDVKIRGGAK